MTEETAMARTKKKAEKAPRRASEKQVAILGVLQKATAPMTPAEVGVLCGREKGSPASDWAYPAIKSLVRKGSVQKAGPGRYLASIQPAA
jgi:hypothetical protein